MPIDRKCIRTEGRDEVLCLLSWWGHLQQCGPPRGILGHAIRGYCATHSQYMLTPLLKRPPWKLLKRNHLEGSSPLINSQGGRKCCTPPDQSLPPGRFLPSLRAPNKGLIGGGLVRGLFDASRQVISWRPKNQIRAHITYKGIRCGPACSPTPRLPGSNGLPTKKPITREGPWCTPKPLTDSSSDGAHCGDNEHQLHCKGRGDWGNLYGYHNHFHGESGPQWPWAEDPNQGAHYRGHHRPHLMN